MKKQWDIRLGGDPRLCHVKKWFLHLIIFFSFSDISKSLWGLRSLNCGHSHQSRWLVLGLPWLSGLGIYIYIDFATRWNILFLFKKALLFTNRKLKNACSLFSIIVLIHDRGHLTVNDRHYLTVFPFSWLNITSSMLK